MTPKKQDVDVDLNSHVRSFIEYYSGKSAPGYAVLITGAWGVGKTFLLKDILPWEGERAKSVYVSLFGLKTSDEVMGTLYAQIDPGGHKLKKALSGLGDAVKGISIFGVGIGGAGTALTSMASSLITTNLDNTKVVIFDDLERSRLSTKAILGVLNQLVEHLGFKVVVVAHDEKLATEFVFTKEKIFGQTLEVNPQVERAFEAFSSEIADHKIKNEIVSFKDAITLTFRNGGFGSLRLLRHGISDAARLMACVDDSFKQNRSAITEIISTFIAFDLELRSGNIEKDDILNQRNKLLAAAMRRVSGKAVDANLDRLQSIHQKYSNINIESGLISEKFLYDALVRGHFDSEELTSSIKASPYFVKTQQLPTWRRIYNFDSESNNDIKLYVKELEESFAQKSIVEIGDVLHSFCARLLLSSRKQIKKSIKTVERECIAYIDALTANGALEQGSVSEWLEAPFRTQSAHGFAFWVDHGCEPSFERIVKHLERRQRRILEKSYPEIADKLVAILSESPEKFVSSISYMGDGKHEFADVPVLKAIKPRRFVKAILESPRENNGWHVIRTGLERRYSGSVLTGKLAAEKQWILAVLAELRKEAEKLNGLSKFRVERLIPKLGV